VLSVPRDYSTLDNYVCAQFCGGKKGHAATIESAGENSFVHDLAAAAGVSGSVWLGGHIMANNDWDWTSGKCFFNGRTQAVAGTCSTGGGMFVNWGTNQPDNGGKDPSIRSEECTAMLVGGSDDGKWRDLSCSGNSVPAVIEFDTVWNTPSEMNFVEENALQPAHRLKRKVPAGKRHTHA